MRLWQRQGGHLVRLWELPLLGQRLVADLKMPVVMVQALKSWGGTQHVVTSLAGGEVTFQPRVAMRVRIHAVRQHFELDWYDGVGESIR